MELFAQAYIIFREKYNGDLLLVYGHTHTHTPTHTITHTLTHYVTTSKPHFLSGITPICHLYSVTHCKGIWRVFLYHFIMNSIKTKIIFFYLRNQTECGLLNFITSDTTLAQTLGLYINYVM